MIVSLQILEQLFRVASTLKNIPDDEAVLTAKLDRFERRQAIRATLQVLTFFVLVWALIAVRWMNHPAYFTTAFFHDPKELEAEIQESGFLYERTVPIEGPLWLFPDVVAHFHDQRRCESFLRFVRRLEQEPSLLGASAHLLAIARKEEQR